MFRKEKLVLPSSEIAVMATIACIVAVVGSVFFGLVLNLSIWYAYTLRCMIFAPLGYLVAKRFYESENIVQLKEKIIANTFVTVVFSLILLFIFGMVFATPDTGIMTLSCMLPFAIALFASTNWKNTDTNDTDWGKADECPYEVENPKETEENPDEESGEDS